jgi:hypothetical protein
MKKLNFLGNCPGCGDTHVEILARKPTFVVPTVAKATCDKCESKILYRLTLPRGGRTSTQVAYAAVKFAPSRMLLDVLAKRAVETTLNPPLDVPDFWNPETNAAGVTPEAIAGIIVGDESTSHTHSTEELETVVAEGAAILSDT